MREEWLMAASVVIACPHVQSGRDAKHDQFHAAISACEKGGQWQRAVLLFGNMRKAIVNKNMISSSVAIAACEKGGQC